MRIYRRNVNAAAGELKCVIAGDPTAQRLEVGRAE